MGRTVSKATSKCIQASARCSVCDNLYMFWRRKNRVKEEGHHKHIYCFKCKQETLHIEEKQ